ncbi:MAG: hypothetical protein ACTSQY_01845 [Candidatus Odinarchaeia archaeon]
MCEYTNLSKISENVFVTNKAISIIKGLNSLVFDCDGVLLKTDTSYDTAIQETVDLFFSKIFNQKLKNLVTPENILLIRNTGGFNNDWELTYAFVLYYFYQISEFISKKQSIILPKTTSVEQSLEYLPKILDLIGLKNLSIEKILKPKNHNIEEYVSYLDKSGLRTSRKVLYLWTENLSQIQFLQRIEEFMKFTNDLNVDIITRIFQELYLGPLITKFYGLNQLLNVKKGYIENETLNGKLKDYKNLLKMGINKFGIASSRPRKEAEYVLRKFKIIPNLVNTDALVFLEDIKEEEKNINQKISEKVSLEKPNPFSILKSLEKMDNINVAAYVGDTVADIYAVIAANHQLNRPILSIGFTGLAYNQKFLETKFKSLKTDIIVPSIKELVDVIKELK